MPALQTDTRRSGDAVDAGVPISDIVRDPRYAKPVPDKDFPREVRYRWQAGLNFSADLRFRQWVRNVLLVYGDPDIQWSVRAGRWLSTPLRRLKPYKTNLLPGRMSVFAGKMTQNAPDWTAIPAGDDSASEESAKFCEKLLRFAYYEQRVDLARYFAVIQMMLFGFGLLETYVDEEADYEPIYETEVDENRAPIFDDQGMPVYKTDKNGRPRITGLDPLPGIKVRPVSPFAFVTPPGVEWPLIKQCPYIIRATWLSESYIRRRFDVPKDVTLVGDSSYYGNYESMTSYIWQAMSPQTVSTTRLETGRLLVLQYYEPRRDAEGFYEGRILTVCGDTLVGDEPSLFEDGRYPFFMFPWLPVTDSFYPFPWLNPMVDPQMRLNQTLTHMMDHLGRVGSPNIIMDRGSGFPTKPSFQYKVYPTSPGMRRPEYMQAPAMPTGAYEMHSQAAHDIDEVSVSYAPSRGAVGGETTGVAIRLAQEADQTEMGPFVRMHAREFAGLGEAELDLYRVYGGENRTLAIVGEDQRPGFFEFKRAGIPIAQRVAVQESSLIVHYRAALEERAVSIGQAGGYGNLLTDSGAQQKFMRSIRDPHMNGPLTPEECQRQYIDQIHYKLLHEGEDVPVEEWWDIDAHRAAAHERLCRESLRWDEAQKTRFMTYWSALEDAATKVAEEQAKQQDEQVQDAIAAQAAIADGEANAKAKVEYLRGTNKLAIESMKQPDMAAGAGAGAAALSANQKPNGAEKPQPKEGAA